MPPGGLRGRRVRRGRSSKDSDWASQKVAQPQAKGERKRKGAVLGRAGSGSGSGSAFERRKGRGGRRQSTETKSEVRAQTGQKASRPQLLQESLERLKIIGCFATLTPVTAVVVPLLATDRATGRPARKTTILRPVDSRPTRRLPVDAIQPVEMGPGHSHPGAASRGWPPNQRRWTGLSLSASGGACPLGRFQLDSKAQKGTDQSEDAFMRDAIPGRRVTVMEGRRKSVGETEWREGEKQEMTRVVIGTRMIEGRGC